MERAYDQDFATRIDYPLIIILASLLLVGLMMVYSSSFDFGYRVFDQPTYFFVKQIIWALLGTAGMIVMMSIDYRTWRRFSIPLMGGTLFLLMLLLIVGQERLGAVRTLFAGSVQPSELCKLIIIIYVADWLSSKGERLRMVTYGLIPFAILIGVVAGLIVLQPNFSTAILIVVTAIGMFFIAGADILQLIIGLVFGGTTFALLIYRSGHAFQRVKDYIGSFSGADVNYHIQQNLSALRAGGVPGVGLGNGVYKLGILPLAHNDSIFAVLGEELGLIGCLLVVGLFAALAYRGFKIALEAPDDFGTVLAAGLTCWLIFQALINVAVTTNTMPFTGIPLPFISYGGSSLVVSMAGVGLLLGISRGPVEERSEESARYDFGRRNGRPRISNSRRR
ncbi:MAG: putative lipid II flippase FtsW [Chloroflexi bacterium]|nr:putative lipid II flippase FtsW [Chloroflexota bacterium]